MKLQLLASSASSEPRATVNLINSVDQAFTDNVSNPAISAEQAASSDETERGVSKILPGDIKHEQLVTMQSTVKSMSAADVGILSGVKNERNKLRVIKQRHLHDKNQKAGGPDVGVLDGRRRGGEWQRTLHARRFLQDKNPSYLCYGDGGLPGWQYVNNLFGKLGDYPKCTCPSPDTCGPFLCDCLQFSDGDLLQCMEPFNVLCEGTDELNGIVGPWSMEGCMGSKYWSISYCSWLPCLVNGDSYWQCKCNWYENDCAKYQDTHCAVAKCCQAQTDDEGRKACAYEGYKDYAGNDTEGTDAVNMSHEQALSKFNECNINSDGGKSIFECYCDTFGYRYCANYGEKSPNLCKALTCCLEQADDIGRLDCFQRYRDNNYTGRPLSVDSETIQESCVASGKSKDQCNCDIAALTNCVFGIEMNLNREPSSELFHCCQSQTDDEGRKDCLSVDSAQSKYKECIALGNSTESCYCRKISSLCSSGHSDEQDCELDTCCQGQSDDAGRKECIAKSQPSSAPSESRIHVITTKALVAVVIGWLLFT